MDEQWTVIKHAHEWGWRSSRLTANEFAREAVIACDSLRGQWSMKTLGTRSFEIHPWWWKQLFFNLQSEYFSLLDYVLLLYIIYL